ncbi:ATP-binding cassette sub-family A member 5-like [Lingula anatina]|uniref:ATP-binding cassette sub-family A member 5-like n=1 Tax=Lingula anatina TaxID=7574 RepID=A0A1S3IK32_LINAN|nr:ATP-binding cassette sub-family A member 5-like [Lingula anatina]|eukprot:XP_013398468.1 ATP-binding cassette sub-family A member 5-like [Lingula anatina]
MSGSTYVQQIKALVTRNILIKRRNWVVFFLTEIFLPVALIAVTAVLKLSVPVTPWPAVEKFDENQLFQNQFYPPSSRSIMVVPKSSVIQEIMNDATSSLNITANPPFQMFDTENDMITEFRENSSHYSIAVVFENADLSNGSYKIRVAYKDTPSDGIDESEDARSPSPPIQGPGTYCRTGRYNCPANQYLWSGFATLQVAVDSAILKRKANLSTFVVPDISVEMMPKARYEPTADWLQGLVSVWIVVTFASAIVDFQKQLVTEKKKKLKEPMKLMGMKEFSYWFSWTVVYGVVSTVMAFIVAGILFIGTVFTVSNYGLIVLLMLLYIYATYSLVYSLSTFFTNDTLSGLLIFFSVMVMGALFYVVQGPRFFGENVPLGVIWFLCIFPPTAVAIGMDQAIFLDLKVGGVHTSTMYYTNTIQNFALGNVYLMLFLDIILYSLLGAWLNNVVPNVYGKRKSMLFFLKRSYWSSERHEPKDYSKYTLDAETVDDVENVPQSMEDKKAIRLYNIKKYFMKREKRKKKSLFGSYESVKAYAVNGVSLDMYEGQITALLGHNGAGKSTVINMMTGLMSPSDGACTIFGQDVQEDSDLERIQQSLGVCPQHDILFDDLSAKEHLEIFARLKGIHEDLVESEVKRILDLCDLEDQVHTFAKDLSGGQRRKLSVGIALIGDPKVIFLDEPTAGMDPYSRRKLWTLLKQVRPGKVILLTTHFMDEADILADRKAILSKGQLKCCGSSMYLKNKFGIGYRLNMVIDQNCDQDKVTELVLHHVPSSKLTRSHGMVLTYTLPMDQTDRFAGLFEALENTEGGKRFADQLGVNDFGISMPTLEEVFLKLAEEGKEEEDLQKLLDVKDEDTNITHSRAALAINNDDETTAVQLQDMHRPEVIANPELREKQQFWGLVRTRLILVRRLWILAIIRWILPVACGIGGAALLTIRPDFDFSNPPTNQLSNSAARMAGIAEQTPVLWLNSTGGPVDPFINSLRETVNYIAELNASSSLQDLAPHYIAYNLSTFDVQAQAFNASLKVLYNDSATHVIPILLNQWSNTMLSSLTGQQWTWNITSQALPELNPLVGFDGNTFNAIRLLSLGYALLTSMFGYQVTEDRQKKTRAMLRIAGITNAMYWLGFLFVDGVQCLSGVVIMTGGSLAVQPRSFTHVGAIFTFIVGSLIYIPLGLLFGYTTSFLFEKAESASSFGTWSAMLGGTIPYLVVSLLDPVSAPASVALHYFFCIVSPLYTIAGLVHFIGKVYQGFQILGRENEITFGDYFTADRHVLFTLLLMLVEVVIWFFLLRLADVTSMGGSARDALFCSRKKGNAVSATNKDHIEKEDLDVLEERRRVEELDAYSCRSDAPVLVVKNLRKEFDKRTGQGCCGIGASKVKVIVRNLCFAVQPGEVFGLLGHNGAGKSTTINCITAEYAPTRGKVTVAGYDITSNISEAFRYVGLCPQHDALWDYLTLRDHIEVFATIRGLAKKDITKIVDYFMEALQITEHANKRSNKLSGGTKRKLSFIISMLGQPKIVLMDEPSTGLDPASKRFLWDTITDMFNGSGERGAILTTHAMEEADALCTRIGIMVGGEFKCMGASQHLKLKFGQGYVLEIKLRAEGLTTGEQEQKWAVLKHELKMVFPDIEELELFGDRAQFKIPQEDVKSLAEVFTSLERAKEVNDVEEYSFSQSTLEQVFVAFARQEYEQVEIVTS